MAGELYLCPCCAAHLRVPPELHVMRCDNCSAELAFIESGGVSGLALLPPVGEVPYSTPAQRGARTHKSFDAGALLANRRDLLLRRALRSHARWSGVFVLCMAAVVSVFAVGIGGGRELFTGSREHQELAALAMLGAMLTLPIVAYVALYFQGRSRLALEQARRWSS
ncbi:MAG: hypothetical protein IPK87_07200 [Planctomycetes bacterium]|nr:hypothetical protein [Planctomycetota bacterium]